jgi:hypothetical protein
LVRALVLVLVLVLVRHMLPLPPTTLMTPQHLSI